MVTGVVTWWVNRGNRTANLSSALLNLLKSVSRLAELADTARQEAEEARGRRDQQTEALLELAATIHVGSTPPENPEEGQLWVDTS